MASEPVPLSGLARRLVEENILDAESRINASEEARKQGTPFVSYLVQNGLAEARTIAITRIRRIRRAAHRPVVFRPRVDPRDLVKENLIRQHNALPLVRRGVRLFVAVPTRPTCRRWTRSSSTPGSAPKPSWSKTTS